MRSTPTAPLGPINALHDGLRTTSRTLLIAGIALIVLGTIAIILPEVASLVVVTFVGWMLILTGVAELYLAFQVHGGWKIAGALLTGALSLFAGIYLLAFPLAGVVTLTLFMAAYFLATGVIKAIAAFQLRPVPGWGWALFSAASSIVLGLVVFSDWPGTAAWALGLIVGIDLLFFGWALLGLRSAVHK